LGVGRETYSKNVEDINNNVGLGGTLS